MRFVALAEPEALALENPEPHADGRKAERAKEPPVDERDRLVSRAEGKLFAERRKFRKEREESRKPGISFGSRVRENKAAVGEKASLEKALGRPVGGTARDAVLPEQNGAPPVGRKRRFRRNEVRHQARFVSGRMCGKSSTSRIVEAFVRSITKRSMPMPQPPVGGRPYSSARM